MTPSLPLGAVPDLVTAEVGALMTARAEEGTRHSTKPWGEWSQQQDQRGNGTLHGAQGEKSTTEELKGRTTHPVKRKH